MGWKEKTVATRPRRLMVFMVLLALCVGVLVWGLADPGGFFDSPKSYGAFTIAPVGVFLFGWGLLREVRGEDTRRGAT